MVVKKAQFNFNGLYDFEIQSWYNKTYLKAYNEVKKRLINKNSSHVKKKHPKFWFWDMVL